MPRVIVSPLTFTSLGYSEVPPFAWEDNSKAILGVRQDIVRPSGFALGPLSPIEVPTGGKPRLLASFKSVAGGLDGLLWVGGRGLAVAEFGTKGQYYRPEHNDPMPTLAIVDGRKGKVIQTVPMPPPTSEQPSSVVEDIDARFDPRGKISALILLAGRRWFEWKQGRLLREISLHPEPARFLKFALSPDMTTVLIAHHLSAQGTLCEYHGGPSRPECEERTPQTGVIADLWNVESGRRLWSITATATDFSQVYRPAISPDGRYALVGLPSGKGSDQGLIALISMADGHEIQRFNKPGRSTFILRFGRDSHSFSMDEQGAILMYRLHP